MKTTHQIKSNFNSFQPTCSIINRIAMMAAVCVFVGTTQDVFAQQNEPGSFDKLVQSFRTNDTMILEGPALNGPVEVNSRSITQVQGGEIISGDVLDSIPGPFDQLPSVITPQQPQFQQPQFRPQPSQSGYPADTFVDSAPEFEAPAIQGPAAYSQWQRPLDESQYLLPQAPDLIAPPELTAPRVIPRAVPQTLPTPIQSAPQANISPAIPSAPSQFIPPTQLPPRQYAQPQFAPRAQRPGVNELDCAYERSRREQARYAPTGYIPYGGRGLDPEDEFRRPDVYRARYNNSERVELELMRLRQSLRSHYAVPIRPPYGRSNAPFGFRF